MPGHPRRARNTRHEHLTKRRGAPPANQRRAKTPGFPRRARGQFRASCPKLGDRSSAPQCVAGSDVAEQQRSVATDDVAKRMAQTTKTKRGETPAAGWIEGPAPRGGGLNDADSVAAGIHPVSGVERQKNVRTTLAGPIPYLQEGHFGRIPRNGRFCDFWRQRRPSDERREEKITERSRAEQSRAEH